MHKHDFIYGKKKKNKPITPNMYIKTLNEREKEEEEKG